MRRAELFNTKHAGSTLSQVVTGSRSDRADPSDNGIKSGRIHCFTAAHLAATRRRVSRFLAAIAAVVMLFESSVILAIAGRCN
jgi:hypothetical protein